MKNMFVRGTARRACALTADPSADVKFILGGLKAAQNSQRSVRENVMIDVSKALNCDPKDLDFLFAGSHESDSHASIFDFPDSERRRSIIRNNVVDAAE